MLSVIFLGLCRNLKLFIRKQQSVFLDTYICGIVVYGLENKQNADFSLYGYTNADYIGSVDDMKSTSSFISFWDLVRYLGSAKSKPLLVALPQRQNIASQMELSMR